MLKQTIIDRYIGKEILFSWFAVFIVLTLIISGSTLGNLFSQAADGSLPNNVVFTLLFNATLRFSVQLLPISLFIGALFAFGRLYKDSEMVSMFACGITYKALYRPLFLIAVPMALLSAIANFMMVPALKHEYYELEATVEDSVDITGVTAGRFTASKGAYPSIFFIERKDKHGKMRHTFLYQSDKSNRSSIETSSTASYYLDDKGRRFMLFENGLRYEGKPGEGDYQAIEYKKHGVYVEDNQSVRVRTKRDEIPSSVLWASDKLTHKAELQWRLAIPVVIIVLAFMAVPFSHTSPRKGRFTKIGPAIIVYIIYSNLLIAALSWMEKGKTPVWLGLWWVHFIFILLGLLLLMKQTRFHKRLLGAS
ncbi:MAG: LPS export ABC transporter permease LptF [Gammaproteobacteria bacterium]|nr:LPS export ABC transporter permease LptF [Gammaproteobacteria bacterium]